RSAPGGPDARPSGPARESWRSDFGHRERLLLLRAAHAAAADARHADPDALDGAVLLDLDALQVGLEGPLAPAGNLAADAAKVLRLAAVRVLVAADRFLTADGTLHAHNRHLLSSLAVACRKSYSIRRRLAGKATLSLRCMSTRQP